MFSSADRTKDYEAWVGEAQALLSLDRPTEALDAASKAIQVQTRATRHALVPHHGMGDRQAFLDLDEFCQKLLHGSPVLACT